MDRMAQPRWKTTIYSETATQRSTERDIALKTGTTTLDPQHLKVKDTEQEINLTKNSYINIRIQKNSSIHKLIFKTQQTIRSHKLKLLRPFLTTPTQKSLKQLLGFLNLH